MIIELYCFKILTLNSSFLCVFERPAEYPSSRASTFVRECLVSHCVSRLETLDEKNEAKKSPEFCHFPWGTHPALVTAVQFGS